MSHDPNTITTTTSDYRQGDGTSGSEVNTTSSPPSRDYQSAIAALNSLQSNADIIQHLAKTRATTNANSIPEMITYLKYLGYQPDELNVLNLIHIAGTKGKGSTSAYCESILRRYRPTNPLKTGLFTSPHMMEVRERIRIDGVPLSTTKFAHYFFECYDRLVGNKDSPLPGPQYFRFLTLMAFHCFMQEKVEVAIIEVGIGGEYDSTNLITSPIVCGITHLGLDHTSILGSTLDEIAWNKAGIFKSGAQAITTPHQDPIAMSVLRDRAEERMCHLSLAEPLDQYDNFPGITLGLGGSHQAENAAVAVSLCKKWLQSVYPTSNPFPSSSTLPDFVTAGLAATTWPGRSQRYVDPHGHIWYLDGAHTTSSLQACLNWFVTVYDPSLPTTLLFNPAHGRDGTAFLTAIHEAAQSHHLTFPTACFTPNLIHSPSPADATDTATPLDTINHGIHHDHHLELQHQLATTWSTLHSSSTSVHPDITHAVHHLQSPPSSTTSPHQILVTGSLHLVGGVLSALHHPTI